jgi:hypothetical protein
MRAVCGERRGDARGTSTACRSFAVGARQSAPSSMIHNLAPMSLDGDEKHQHEKQVTRTINLDEAKMMLPWCCIVRRDCYPLI